MRLSVSPFSCSMSLMFSSLFIFIFYLFSLSILSSVCLRLSLSFLVLIYASPYVRDKRGQPKIHCGVDISVAAVEPSSLDGYRLEDNIWRFRIRGPVRQHALRKRWRWPHIWDHWGNALVFQHGRLLVAVWQRGLAVMPPLEAHCHLKFGNAWPQRLSGRALIDNPHAVRVNRSGKARDAGWIDEKGSIDLRWQVGLGHL